MMAKSKLMNGKNLKEGSKAEERTESKAFEKKEDAGKGRMKFMKKGKK